MKARSNEQDWAAQILPWWGVLRGSIGARGGECYF